MKYIKTFESFNIDETTNEEIFGLFGKKDDKDKKNPNKLKEALEELIASTFINSDISARIIQNFPQWKGKLPHMNEWRENEEFVKFVGELYEKLEKNEFEKSDKKSLVSLQNGFNNQKENFNKSSGWSSQMTGGSMGGAMS